MGYQHESLADDLLNIVRSKDHTGLPGKSQQVFHDFSAPCGFRFHRVQITGDVIKTLFVEPLALYELHHESDVGQDCGNGVIDLMGDCGRQLAKGSKFFGLKNLLLGHFEFLIGLFEVFIEVCVRDGHTYLIADGRQELHIIG